MSSKASSPRAWYTTLYCIAPDPGVYEGLSCPPCPPCPPVKLEHSAFLCSSGVFTCGLSPGPELCAPGALLSGSGPLLPNGKHLHRSGASDIQPSHEGHVHQSLVQCTGPSYMVHKVLQNSIGPSRSPEGSSCPSCPTMGLLIKLSISVLYSAFLCS